MTIATRDKEASHSDQAYKSVGVATRMEINERAKFLPDDGDAGFLDENGRLHRAIFPGCLPCKKGKFIGLEKIKRNILEVTEENKNCEKK